MSKVLAGITTSVDGYITGPARGTIELEHIGVRKSPFATFVDYRVRTAA